MTSDHNIYKYDIDSNGSLGFCITVRGSYVDDYLYRIKTDVVLSEQEQKDTIGAFARLEHTPFQHQVYEEVRSTIRQTQKRIDFIRDNLCGKWSIAVHLDHVSKGNVIWSFENPSEAVLFKLTWASSEPIESAAA